jgi:glutamine amidotransferase PdxT
MHTYPATHRTCNRRQILLLQLLPAGQKKGGQALLGGLDICVSRNFFGAQVNSFETQLPAHTALQQYGPDGKFRAVFIRAPAVLEAGPQVSSGHVGCCNL